jgi:hypothetical protein
MDPLILHEGNEGLPSLSDFIQIETHSVRSLSLNPTMRRATFPLAALIIVLWAIAGMPKITGVLSNHQQDGSPASLQPQSDKRAAWQTLLKFQNQSLSKLAKTSREELQKAIDELVGKRENETVIPHLVTTISNSKGQTRYALIEEFPLLTIPGNSGLSVHLFAGDGSLIRSAVFQTGWRIFVTDIRVAYLEEIGRMAIEVRSAPAINGRDVARQLYALVNDEVLLVRLEDKGGHLIRNVYGAPNHTFGFTITGRSSNEWKDALESGDSAEVLATLTWLSGTHLDPKEKVPEVAGMPPVAHEDLSEAQLVRDVLNSEAVRRDIKTLMLSKNLWVRQGAKLADNPESYSWGIKIR